MAANGSHYSVVYLLLPAGKVGTISTPRGDYMYHGVVDQVHIEGQPHNREDR